MVKAKWILFKLFLVIILLSLTVRGTEISFAQEDEPPQRQTTIVLSYTEYEWWLLSWSENQIVCVIYIDHEGIPTHEEVYDLCGAKLYEEWKDTPSCEVEVANEDGTTDCIGLYLHFISSYPAERTVVLDLPPATVWIALSGCSPIPPENLCENLPTLLLLGEEPLPNEQVTAIHYILDEVTYTCEGDVCEIPLNPTPLEGIEIEFWADSSYGDSSDHYFALVRVLDTGILQLPIAGNWYVDVLSSQWLGDKVDACAQIWHALPPPGPLPEWLSTPDDIQFLQSDEPYHLLAGRLIENGVVDASECPNDGLLPNGYANECGQEVAQPAVTRWQNQFDGPILLAANKLSLPAQLMKNQYAVESQFWPGEFRIVDEFGLGQLTDMGADTVLLWNQSLYDQYCPLVLDESVCSAGYLGLSEEERTLLRGALAVTANADCAECPTGINLPHADNTVMLFSQTLLANCDQVAQTVYNATENTPGDVTTYENLWRFTLANYHVGSGCLSYAIHTTWQQRQPLSWDNVSTHFTEPCQSAIPYVGIITK
jgi:hypothetical protein